MRKHTKQRLLAAACILLGVLLGLRGGGDALTRDEDAEDDEYRRRHGDPRPGERH